MTLPTKVKGFLKIPAANVTLLYHYIIQINLPGPKYAYLRPPGSGLSSSCGASSLECKSFFLFSSSSSKQGFHPLLIAIIYCSSKTCEESNKEKFSDT